MEVYRPHTLPDGRAVRFTKHALERMLDMSIDAETVRAALTDPTQFETDSRGRARYCHGRVAVVVAHDDRNPGGLVVVSVLWRDGKAWLEDLSRGEYAGRTISKTEALWKLGGRDA
jgi:hypothetical protein